MKSVKIQFAALVALSLSGIGASAASISLSGTIRDFHYDGTSDAPLAGHVDFENVIAGVEPGIVTSTLGVDGKPVYNTGNSAASVHGAGPFNQWYNNTPGVNLSSAYSITLNETSPGSGVYAYENSDFFPIDNQLGGNQGNPSHNYAFTYELHTSFTYQAGQVFDFSGDDDVWVYINKQLVIDLGGVHSTAGASVDLDTLSLTPGNAYDFDFFFAERHTTGSNFKISTSIELVSNVPDAGSTASLLGASLLGFVALGRFRKQSR